MTEPDLSSPSRNETASIARHGRRLARPAARRVRRAGHLLRRLSSVLEARAAAATSCQADSHALNRHLTGGPQP